MCVQERRGEANRCAHMHEFSIVKKVLASIFTLIQSRVAISLIGFSLRTFGGRFPISPSLTATSAGPSSAASTAVEASSPRPAVAAARNSAGIGGEILEKKTCFPVLLVLLLSLLFSRMHPSQGSFSFYARANKRKTFPFSVPIKFKPKFNYL